MWKLYHNPMYWLLVTLWPWVLISCGFIDLRPIGYSLIPDEADGVVDEGFSAIGISFDTEMEQQEVEQALSVSSKEGTIEGDRHWEGNSLLFVPLAPWKAGIRYNLAVKGLIHAKDGRELRLSVDHPFYGLRKGTVPVLWDVDPPSGARVPVQGTDSPLTAPHGPPLRFRFSRSMNRQTVQDALTIEGVDLLDWRWSDEDREVLVTPRKPLQPWTVYRWTLTTIATSSEGIPLGKEERGTFCTDLDTERPRIERTFCLGRTDTGWVDLGRSLSELDVGQALGIRFSKPMNRESMLQALRFEPSLSGITIQIDEQTAAYVPDRSPEPETTYVLIVSQETRDLSGLSLAQEYREAFIPAIPYLKLLSVKANEEPEFFGPFSGSSPACYTVSLEAPEGKLSINLQFSQSFSDEAQRAVLKQVSLSPYFPGSLAPVALQSALWLSSSTLRLVWVGLEGGSGDQSHYYRLSLAGGRSGISTSTQDSLGYWLKDSIALMLEALP